MSAICGAVARLFLPASAAECSDLFENVQPSAGCRVMYESVQSGAGMGIKALLAICAVLAVLAVIALTFAMTRPAALLGMTKP
jgi:hypothetical protein